MNADAPKSNCALLYFLDPKVGIQNYTLHHNHPASMARDLEELEVGPVEHAV